MNRARFRFNHIFEGITTIDTRYQPFTNTFDNGSGDSSSSETDISSYANGGETGTGLGKKVDTKGLEKTFNAATKALTGNLSGLGSLKGNLDNAGGPEEIKLMILERFLIESGDRDALNTFTLPSIRAVVLIELLTILNQCFPVKLIISLPIFKTK